MVWPASFCPNRWYQDRLWSLRTSWGTKRRSSTTRTPRRPRRSRLRLARQAGRPTYVDDRGQQSVEPDRGHAPRRGDFDPSTGVIGPGSLWGPVFPSMVSYSGFDLLIASRLSQVSDATGQVNADGTASFGPVSLEYDTYAATIWSSTVAMDDCRTTMVATLTGTADENGLHLSASDVPVPLMPSGACAGFSNTVNAGLGPADIVFDVEGFLQATGCGDGGMFALYPSVAVYNQNSVQASVPPGATGSVTFRDGATALGSAPVGEDGRATMVTAMPEAGSRTVRLPMPVTATIRPRDGLRRWRSRRRRLAW